jgi:16S rRNA (cytidine1402-2'-O)-methyltransferase
MPLKPDKRVTKLREMERKAFTGETQIFMETPYRASKLKDYLISNLNPELRLCIATDITLESEKILTKKISEWKSIKADQEKPLSIFLICI